MTSPSAAARGRHQIGLAGTLVLTLGLVSSLVSFKSEGSQLARDFKEQSCLGFRCFFGLCTVTIKSLFVLVSVVYPPSPLL